MESKKILNKSTIESFFCNKIREFRREYDNLDDLEKKCIPKPATYEYPCQIEIFWISEPLEYQLVILFHDDSREDGEIKINGPYQGKEFIEQVVIVVKDEWWKRQAPYEKDEFDLFYDREVGNQEGKYSDYLLDPLSHLIHLIRNDPLSGYKTGFLESAAIRNDDCYAIIKGSITELNSDELSFLDSIHYAKKFAAIMRKKIENPKISAEFSTNINDKEQKSEKVVGTYYYPHVRIGDQVELSFHEKLIDAIGQPYNPPKVDFQFQIANYEGFYDTFGFVGIQINEKKEAMKLLNTIFGISCLFGYEFLSVREFDLYCGGINKETQTFGGLSYFIGNKRGKATSSYGNRSIHIAQNVMENIISISDLICKEKELNECVHFFLESITHYSGKEFSQSFIFSWLVAEKDIAQKFNELLEEKNVTGKRKKKFMQFLKWPTESKLEMLAFTGKIDNQQYKFLIGNNSKRNKVFHSGEFVTEDESKEMLTYVTKLLRDIITNLGMDFNPIS